MRRPTTNRRPAASRTWLGTDAQVIRHVHVCGDGHLATATRIELERQGIHRDTDYLLPSLRPALVIACADSEADQSFTDAAQQALDEGSPLLLCCLAGPIVRLGPLIEPYACFASASLSQPAPAPPSPAEPPPAARSPTPSSPAKPSRAARSPTQTSPAKPSPAARSPTARAPARPSRAPLSPAARSAASPPPAPPSPASPPERQPHLAQPPTGRPVKVEAPLNPEARLAALLVSAQALNFLLGARNQCVTDRVVELNPWSMESTGYRVFHN
jgi:hypothetical protein